MADPSRESYLRMARNRAWANAAVYAALRCVGAKDFAAERPGFFPSLGRVLNHIYEVDLYYLDALEQGGLGRSVYDRADLDTPAALARAQQGADMRLAAFCNALTPGTLAEMRETERKEGTTSERAGALLLHLFQHQIHHRGQAHTMVLHAGIAPPQLDDCYLDYGRAPSARAYWGG